MKTDEIMRRIREIEVVDNCHSCQKDGCRTAENKEIPCDHVGDCACDDHCVCDCHKWEQTLILAHNRLAQYTIKEREAA